MLQYVYDMKEENVHEMVTHIRHNNECARAVSVQ